MRDGEIDVFSSPGYLDGPVVSGGITLAPDEGVLWAGGPARIPWWFGGHDVYLTAFMLAWLAFVAGMGVLAVHSGSAAFLMVVLCADQSQADHDLATAGRRYTGCCPGVACCAAPPSVRGGSIFTGLACSDGSGQRSGGWRELTWPATTVVPPALIALADTQEGRAAHRRRPDRHPRADEQIALTGTFSPGVPAAKSTCQNRSICARGRSLRRLRQGRKYSAAGATACYVFS